MVIQKNHTNTAVCHLCGTPIGANSYVREGSEFCCEGCYLSSIGGGTGSIEEDDNYPGMVEALITALDEREHETGMHSKRVACHARVLARTITDDADFLQQIYWGSLLHDIGKIAIPDAVLLKQGPLSEQEWTVMRSHPEKGYAIVKCVPFLGEAATIVLNHEERYDGSGYPHGSCGDEIPYGVRLFSVIDTLDAMTSDRPYRAAMKFDKAKDEIVNMSGSQFDPGAVEIFLNSEPILRRMVELKCIDETDLHT